MALNSMTINQQVSDNGSEGLFLEYRFGGPDVRARSCVPLEAELTVNIPAAGVIHTLTIGDLCVRC